MAITLSGTVEANLLTFTATGYAILGGTQITLNGTTPTITVNDAGTISSVLAGSAGLIRAGLGR